MALRRAFRSLSSEYRAAVFSVVSMAAATEVLSSRARRSRRAASRSGSLVPIRLVAAARRCAASGLFRPTTACRFSICRRRRLLMVIGAAARDSTVPRSASTERVMESPAAVGALAEHDAVVGTVQQQAPVLQRFEQRIRPGMAGMSQRIDGGGFVVEAAAAQLLQHLFYSGCRFSGRRFGLSHTRQTQ